MEKGYLAFRLKVLVSQELNSKEFTDGEEAVLSKAAEVLESLVSSAVLVSDEHGGGYDDCGCDLCDAVRDLIDA